MPIRSLPRASPFIRRFELPPSDDLICPAFDHLVAAGGCPFTCSWCFLQTVPRFLFAPDQLPGVIHADAMPRLLSEITSFLASPAPRSLVVGELQDGLAFEGAFARATGKTLSQWLVPLFAAQSRHRLVFVTKSLKAGALLTLPPTPQVAVSFSINADTVAAQWEQGAPSPSRRLDHAARLTAAGWPVRIRLDPMIPVPNWPAAYAPVLDRIAALPPEVVTLGTLRATNPGALKAAARRHGRHPPPIHLLERGPTKARLPAAERQALYAFALSRLPPTIPVALCKESQSMWTSLALTFRGCNCHGTASPPP